jgi:putative flavoprotein involved in K+ transport
VKPKQLVAAGVERVGRTTGVVGGHPEVGGDDVLDVANVVWCTGFSPGFDWIDLPVFDDQGDVIHDRGVVESEPGLYFVGLKFLYSALSDTLLAIGRDSGYVVEDISTSDRSHPMSRAVRT